jgi:hypothetical protein
MTYEEYTRREDAARKESANKKKAWLILGSMALVIGTCNYISRTHLENSILKKPQAGDYFVFTVKHYDRPYKLKAIKGDSMEFLIPRYAITDFRENHSESKVHELERNGMMYDTLFTIYLNTQVLENLKNNPDLSISLAGEEAHLKTMFGKSRTGF